MFFVRYISRQMFLWKRVSSLQNEWVDDSIMVVAFPLLWLVVQGATQQ